jgi:hypothetical protein
MASFDVQRVQGCGMYAEQGQGLASDVGACTLPVLQNTACLSLEVLSSLQEYMVLMSRNDGSLQCCSDDHQQPALLNCQQLL